MEEGMKRKNLAIFLVFAFITTVNIFSQDKMLEQEILQISKIEDTNKRLSAYDALAKSLDINPNTNYSNNWELEFKNNELDDSMEFYLSNVAISGDKYSPAVIMVRYKNDNFELYINFNKYLADDNKIVIRFDKEQSFVDYWHKSSDKTALFYNGRAMDLIDAMSRYSKMIVQCYPYEESEYTVTFDIRGLKNEMQKVIEKGFFKN